MCMAWPWLVPVLSSGAGFVKMVGHHLWWTLIWITAWRAVHRFGWATAAIAIAALLALGTILLQRPGSSTARRRRGRTRPP